MVRMAAAELPRIGLQDALLITALIAEHDDDRFERAAARWLGRLALEAPRVELTDLRDAAELLDALPDESALDQLGQLCQRHGVDR